MAVNEVNIIRAAGGLGTPLQGQDYISSYIHYTTVLPSGFGSSDRIKTVFSLSEAEDLGITDTSIGETKSTGTYTFTNKGVVGDEVLLTVADINSTIEGESVLTLASYTTVAADVATLITAAAKLAAAINAGTQTHGWTAVSDGIDTVTFTAAAGQGIFLNSGTPYVMTITGITAGTLVQNVISGVASEINDIHYHVKEFFRAQPKGKLYIGIYTLSADFAEINTVQDYSGGEIRQMGIYSQATFATSDLNLMQTQANLAATNHKQIEIIYQGDFSGVSDLTTLSNLFLLSDANVSATIGQDGAAVGYSLWKASGKSIGTVGVTLGAVAFAKVSDSIAYIGKFQMASGELEVLDFANGDKHKNLSDGQINNVDNSGYIFLKKQVSLAGSYFNNPYTAIIQTNDFSRINRNRTMAKAERSLRTFLLPYLASPLLVNNDGTLSDDTVSFFTTECKRALEVMERDEEISAFSVIIDPSQNVISTSKLEITVKIVPIATADEIEVTIGFATSV